MLLANPQDAGLLKAFTADSESAFNSVLERETAVSGASKASGAKAIDEAVDFGFDSASSAASQSSAPAGAADALSLLLKGSGSSSSASAQESRSEPAALNKVVQLTGFSDTIYAETYVQVRQKEIFLDLLLVNQTEETLQAVSLDLNCSGDLKLTEKPPTLTLPPFSFASAKAVVRVTATNHGQIFGCISFLSGPTGQEADSVILAEIKIDVLEYVQPASLPESRFRDQWVLLEWENKISIKVPQLGLRQFMDFLMAAGHLTAITPNAGLEAGAAFLACNLYARSIFDEEILANICLEHTSNGQGSDGDLIKGHLRLRSKTQGLAVAYGDKLNLLIQQLGK